ncbi:glycosyl transferase family 2 [Nitrosococcus halophilus Nc 4]|uniref:Glycosyl transferase family 2 n=1 Tax=Nitrosococcus halophilus (strain Nc4) TaxID=472759 RepID=D5C0P5_NITHN|nr:glycosyltransferase [Nitrosococcus halophilus]ADE16368.1 glycosyl transferase family 2 [Nitrosococcus halophilus Nc 4]
MSSRIELSVIIPVTDRYDNIEEIYYDYKQNIKATNMAFEIVYIVDSHFDEVLENLKKLNKKGERIKIIKLAKSFSETTALNIGFDNSSGDIILTLPAYQQVQASEIPYLIKALDSHDMVVGRRWPRKDSGFNRIRSKLFNLLLKGVSDLQIHDAGCNVRAFKRDVINEVHVYGDLHRFFPIIADRYGFKVVELNVAQSDRDISRRIYSTSAYLRTLLDILTIFFLIKFTKKPLRFFGLLGLGIFFIGLIATLYIVGERLFLGVSLANRPALLLSSLLIVFSIQVMAIGLIGEIIIFTHAKELKEYTVYEIIN